MMKAKCTKDENRYNVGLRMPMSDTKQDKGIDIIGEIKQNGLHKLHIERFSRGKSSEKIDNSPLITAIFETIAVLHKNQDNEAKIDVITSKYDLAFKLMVVEYFLDNPFH